MAAVSRDSLKDWVQDSMDGSLQGCSVLFTVFIGKSREEMGSKAFMVLSRVSYLCQTPMGKHIARRIST